MFDTFHRYVLPYIEYQKQREYSHSAIRVLDVGSNGIGIGRFLEREKVDLTLLDIKSFSSELIRSYPEYKFVVSKDPMRVPFEDNTFDLVVSIDVLEHISDRDRENFINELIRVSKDKVVLVFPEGKATIFAEKAMSYVYLRRNKFLLEHEALGLPKIDDVVKSVRSNRRVLDLKVQSSLNLILWFPIKLASTFLNIVFKGKLEQKYFRFYRRYLYPLLNFGSTYGKCTVISVSK